jgi:ABC-type uncharacterized transport system substrate-binding protein
MTKFLIPILFIINILHAHPHTFIEIYPTIAVKNNIMQNIKFKWQLDEMTSSMLIMEFDTNANGKLEDKENKFVYENYFLTLVDYNFYTDITVDGKIQSFPTPKNFKATIENNKLCYYFEIDNKYNINNTMFDFGDKDFFVAMILKKEFATVQNASAKVSDLDNDFYFGYRLELK